VSSLAADLRPRLILEIDIGELLAILVTHDKAGILLFNGPGRGEAAFCHVVLSHYGPRTHYFGRGGDDVMHFANYIVLGLLIVCMLSAAAMALSRVKSH
jgi:hypothetical protein